MLRKKRRTNHNLGMVRAKLPDPSNTEAARNDHDDDGVRCRSGVS